MEAEIGDGALGGSAVTPLHVHDATHIVAFKGSIAESLSLGGMQAFGLDRLVAESANFLLFLWFAAAAEGTGRARPFNSRMTLPAKRETTIVRFNSLPGALRHACGD